MKYEIDIIELCILAEACIPPNPIARTVLFERLSNEFYPKMSSTERKRLFDCLKNKINMENEYCKVFYNRFNPDNQYLVETDYKKVIEKTECFKMDGLYYITPDTNILEKYITNVTKL